MLQKYYQIWGKHRAIKCLYTVCTVCIFCTPFALYTCNSHSDNAQPSCCNISTHGSAKNTNTTKVLSASPKVEILIATKLLLASPKIQTQIQIEQKYSLFWRNHNLQQITQIATMILIVPKQKQITWKELIVYNLTNSIARKKMCPPTPEKHKHKTHLLLDKMKDFRQCS